MNPSRTARWLTIAPLAVAIALALAVPAHAAAGGDPYGSTTTTAGEPTAEVSCELSLTVGPPGTAVTANVLNVPFGDTIRVLFGGTEVGRATAPLADQASAEVTSVTIDFVVPDVAAGAYLVTAVGGTFTGECGADGDVLFNVLAATQSRGDGGGALPRTGIYAALLVALALALVVAGRAALAESRRRKRRAARLDAQHYVVGSRRP